MTRARTGLRARATPSSPMLGFRGDATTADATSPATVRAGRGGLAAGGPAGASPPLSAPRQLPQVNRVAARRPRRLARHVQIERFDPAADTSAVRACHEMHLAEWRADGVRRAPLSPRAFRTWLRYGWTEDPQEAWLGRDSEGEVCGWYLLGLPERENRHRATITLVVAPSRRRAGLGTALLGHAADRARQAGRTLLTSHSQEASAGAAFARSLGARRRLTGVFWALRPRSLPAGRLAALRESAASAAADYSLVSWEGPVAEDRLVEVAALDRKSVV